ncbi:hypothetical protein [Anaeromicropila herbilytica]|uniref:hypothetical protein n=1 Tax=Anaeromicropila herbilytica TaxID=2785025 RepID=UPI00232A1B7C|nr:hypothetical protein [Anaeromicropila herbilytica]
MRKKAIEISHVGVNVILDWGFWASKDRIEISEFFKLNNIQYEWHYIDIESDRWKKQIEERNRIIEEGNGGSDLYLDEGLMNKLLSIFEEPNREEIDVWYINS